jgi:hypothetical protein
MQVTLAPRDRVMLTLEKQGANVTHVEHRDQIEHRSCEDVATSIEKMQASQ